MQPRGDLPPREPPSVSYRPTRPPPPIPCTSFRLRRLLTCLYSKARLLISLQSFLDFNSPLSLESLERAEAPACLSFLESQVTFRHFPAASSGGRLPTPPLPRQSRSQPCPAGRLPALVPSPSMALGLETAASLGFLNVLHGKSPLHPSAS